MADSQSLESARKDNYLWPTIADAVDTYLRRRDCGDSGADSYERIWRLIHIWKATIITLAVAAISRYRTIPKRSDVLRKCLEYFYGVSWDQINRELETRQGASDGSIDQWINILSEVSKNENPESNFLVALHNFLNKGTIDLGSLIQVWSLTCEVPPDARNENPFKVKHAIRHINTFRNRFAHVPFPPDPLNKLANALEDITGQLFSVEPFPYKATENSLLKGENSPLTGALGGGKYILRGVMPDSATDGEQPSFQFIFPCHSNNSVEQERWEAFPFIHIDSMIRPHVIARIRNKDEQQGLYEYTRYRAEANAVIVISDIGIPSELRQPKASDYEKEEDSDLDTSHESAQSVGSDMGISRDEPIIELRTILEAIEASRQGNYEASIAYFEKLTQDRPLYHVAWLHLGHTKREQAARLSEKNPEAANEILKGAVVALEKATEHKDREYQASALYELSKTYFRLNDLVKARDKAQKACERSSDPKYQTWMEYIQHKLNIDR